MAVVSWSRHNDIMHRPSSGAPAPCAFLMLLRATVGVGKAEVRLRECGLSCRLWVKEVFQNA
jgi:hypothetical protein